MKAAILEKIGAPLTVADIDLPTEMKRGQVLVRVLCSGICGSQLQEIDGIKGNPDHIPHLLGHEGCGIVLATGKGVTSVKEGDKVCMHWRKGAGIEAEPPFYSWDGIEKPQLWVKAGPITTFSEYAVVSENRLTAVPQDIPNDLAALFGCALSTAISIVENKAKPKIGDVVSVIGCGGVGLSIIFALTMRRNELWTVFGIDRAESKKKLVEQFHLARYAHRRPSNTNLTIDTIENKRVGNGKYISLQKNGTSGGGFDPAKDIPRYCEMFRHGTLDGYEKIITHMIPLDRINAGIEYMRQGKAGRVMIDTR